MCESTRGSLNEDAIADAIPDNALEDRFLNIRCLSEVGGRYGALERDLLCNTKTNNDTEVSGVNNL